LKKAGNKARGATMYVTLEPCCHYGKTPPCTDAIVAAGIKKVVIACKDPNPLVCGKGIHSLKKNGVRVETGLLRKEAAEINEDFFWSVTRGRPWITLKLALTLDGRIADTSGASRWITNSKAREYVHLLRSRHAAIAIGSTTLTKDDPELTVRHIAAKSPIRIVFAQNPSAGKNSKIRKTARNTRSIFVCPGKKAGDKAILSDGTEVWYTGRNSSAQALEAFLKRANQENITSILIEGGQKLASSFLEAGLINRIYLFYGNCLLGKGLSAFHTTKPLPMKRAHYLEKYTKLDFGDSFAITGIITQRR